MKFDVLVMDCDGVLCGAWGFAKKLEREYGITRAHTSSFFGGPFLDCLVGNKDLRVELPPYLEGWGWRGSLDDLLRVWFEADGIVDRDLVAILEDYKSRGIKIAMATNQERHRAGYLRVDMGFDRLFHKFFSSSCVGAMKPEAAFFQAVAAELGVAPDRILFWDDTSKYVEGARSAGWLAEQYIDLESFRSRMKIYLADSISR